VVYYIRSDESWPLKGKELFMYMIINWKFKELNEDLWNECWREPFITKPDKQYDNIVIIIIIFMIMIFINNILILLIIIILLLLSLIIFLLFLLLWFLLKMIIIIITILTII